MSLMKWLYRYIFRIQTVQQKCGEIFFFFNPKVNLTFIEDFYDFSENYIQIELKKYGIPDTVYRHLQCVLGMS